MSRSKANTIRLIANANASAGLDVADVYGSAENENENENILPHAELDLEIIH